MSAHDNPLAALRRLVQRQIEQIDVLQRRVAHLSREARDGKEPVAIVGIGCRFPGGADARGRAGIGGQ